MVSMSKESRVVDRKQEVMDRRWEASHGQEMGGKSWTEETRKSCTERSLSIDMGKISESYSRHHGDESQSKEKQETDIQHCVVDDETRIQASRGDHRRGHGMFMGDEAQRPASASWRLSSPSARSAKGSRRRDPPR